MRSLVLLLVLGCGGGTDELTCAVLEDPANCWARAAVALADCMPARATPAAMSADRRTCTFTDGVTATFDEPLGMASADFANGFAFTVEANGVQCARYTTNLDDLQTLTVTTTVSVALSSDDQLHLSCADGEFVSDLDTVFDCPHPPTLGLLLDAPAVGFFVSSVATPDALFRCEP